VIAASEFEVERPGPIDDDLILHVCRKLRVEGLKPERASETGNTEGDGYYKVRRFEPNRVSTGQKEAIIRNSNLCSFNRVLLFVQYFEPYCSNRHAL
jgi:hypothetical protein